MSKYSSRNNSFQFGLLLFILLGLSIGVILTTGNASLNLFSFAQVVTDYSIKGKPCTGSGKVCSVGDIYTCTDGRYELTQDCAAGGFVTCKGSSGVLPAHCIYANGDSCNFKGTRCSIDGVINRCDNGELMPGRDCAKELLLCVNPNPEAEGATCQSTEFYTYLKCSNNNIYTCNEDGTGCALREKCGLGCVNSSGDTPPHCLSDTPDCGSLGQKCCNNTTCDGSLYCSDTKEGNYCEITGDKTTFFDVEIKEIVDYYSQPSSSNRNADLNNDLIIDILDLGIVLDNLI